LGKKPEFGMNLTLAYSREGDLEALSPLIGKELRGFSISPVKVKEDQLKFVLDQHDLLYTPLPVVGNVKGIKVLSNCSVATDNLGVKFLNKSDNPRIAVKGTNSTEFYLLRLLTNLKVSPVVCEDTCHADALFVEGEEADLDIGSLWRERCGKIPIVMRVISTLRLDQYVLGRLKIALREAASLSKVSDVSKEMGLRGRSALSCFTRICRQRGLCSNSDEDLIIL
jgi:hypothetical protein